MTSDRLREGPINHADCPVYMRDGMAELGADVTVSTAPPLVPTGYEQVAVQCPHGVTYWMEPTSEQRVEWARDGVE